MEGISAGLTRAKIVSRANHLQSVDLCRVAQALERGFATTGLAPCFLSSSFNASIASACRVVSSFRRDMQQFFPRARARVSIRACHSSDWFREGGCRKLFACLRCVAIIESRNPVPSEKGEIDRVLDRRSRGKGRSAA